MKPTIKFLNVKGRFKYLWLKSVTGVDLTNHCARCLEGPYEKRINSTISQAWDITPAAGDAYYLCGVTTPFNWAKNLHVAFVYAKGESFDVDENGIEMVVENARRIQITIDAMNLSSDKNIMDPKFFTCRNWQFAHMFKSLSTMVTGDS